MVPRLLVAVTACLITTSTAFAGHPLFDTGALRPVILNGSLVSVGYSSGWLSDAQPQLWMAQPFVLPAGLWEIDQIDVDYDVRPGFEFLELTFIIWSRDGQNAPVEGDQLVTGTVIAPVGLDDPEVDGVDELLHEIFPTPFLLPGGDYYLTIYGDNGSGFPASAVWAANPENGINLTDGSGNPFAWRSSAFPAPGFEVYNPANVTQDPALLALDPANALDIFNTSFTIYGQPADSDGDGIPDDEDVEGIQEAVDALPTGAFKSGGQANAMNTLLNDVEALIASGDIATAIRKLENLRRHLDGCGTTADTNDWIVDCDVQLEIREIIDTLISNLSS